MLRVMMTKWWKKRGFTLIELLVVIAIIGILAGFLLPAISSARKRAQSSKCINNLHQMMISIRTYTMDYNEAFPAITTSTPSAGAGSNELNPLYSRYLATTELAKCSASTITVSTQSFDVADYAYNYGLTESDASDTLVLADDGIVLGSSSAKHSEPKAYNVAKHDGSVSSIGLTSSEWADRLNLID